MTTEKMVKTAGVLEKILRVLQVITAVIPIITVAAIVVFTVVYIANPEALSGLSVDTSINFGMLTFEAGENTAVDSADILVYCWIAAASAVVFISIMWYTLGIFRKILKPMTEGSPFYPSVSREIRRLAFMCLIGGVVRNIVSLINSANLAHLFEQINQPQFVSMNYVFDLSCVVEFFALLLISYIFSYGEKLQKLSDETL